MIKIDAQNVDFYYGDFHALKNISMQIEANTSVAFIGPSGVESLPSSDCSTA